MTNVRVETPSERIGFGANCLEMTGGRTAVRDADAVPDAPVLVPPWVDETNPLTFTCGPAVVAVTVTGIEQDAPAASVPPVNVSVFPPVITRLPPHVAVVPLGAVRPAGSVSVKARPVSGVAVVFVSRKLMLTVPPNATLAAANDFVIVGAPGAVTVTVAVLDGVPVSETGPLAVIGDVVLFCVPAEAPVTVTMIAQLAAAANVPPVKVNRLPPVITRLPPHVAVVPLGAVRPDGSVSVNARPVSATVAFGFVSDRSRLVVPLTTIDAAPNDFAFVGCATTVIVAVFDVAPAPDSVELSGPVVLFLTPAVAPVTVTVIVQFAPAASVPPVKVSVLPPAITRLPPQVAVEPLG